MPEHGGRPVGDLPLQRSIENFARDLLYLIKAARLYPNGHPTVSAVTERLAAWAPAGGGLPVRFGVTRTELVLDGRFYGGKRSRVNALAGFLHSRRLKSFTLKPGVAALHYGLFAGVLASRTVEGGQALAESLSAVGVHSIGMEALHIARVHDTLSCGGKPKALDGKERGQQVWLWLQAEHTRPEDVARALGSEDFWNSAQAGTEGALEMGYLLSGLGQRLEQGLGLLGTAEREQVLKRLQDVGRRISAGQLADILGRCPDPALMQHDGMLALVGDLEGDKLIDLMAGVVSAEGASSDRFRSLYRQLMAGGEKESLNAVRERIRTGDHRGFTVEVWGTLQSFLLEHCDTPYVGEEYRATLEELADSHGEDRSYRIPVEFAEDPDPHLDLVLVGLAVAAGGRLRQPWEDLFGRIRSRFARDGLGPALTLAEAVDALAPRALDSEPALLCTLLAVACDTPRAMDPSLRKRFGRFARVHREILLEPMLTSLRDAQRVSTRRFLVELLAGMGTDTTPSIICRARAGPWYLTRNLVIVLRLRNDPSALPFLVTALDHEESRVRRQALRALSHFGREGLPSIELFFADRSRDPRDRLLARRLLLGGGAA